MSLSQVNLTPLVCGFFLMSIFLCFKFMFIFMKGNGFSCFLFPFKTFFLYFFLKKKTFVFLLGSSTPIRHISLRSLLPNTEQFMTYEGSTTHPGCWESTVWIILNKPIYITKQEVKISSFFLGGNFL